MAGRTGALALIALGAWTGSASAALMSPFAGNGTNTFSGDGGPATQAGTSMPWSVAQHPDGVLLVHGGGGVVRLVKDGVITRVAGNDLSGYSGDCGQFSCPPATSARFKNPRDLAVLANGHVLVADSTNHAVRAISTGDDGAIGTADDRIATLAGYGVFGFSGDGGNARVAKLNNPQGVAVTSDGGFLVADSSNNRVRKVSGPNASGVRTIQTLAGNGTSPASGDGGNALQAGLPYPRGIVETADGGFFVSSGHTVRRVSAPDASGVRTIERVAGTGAAGFNGEGDGGPATQAKLYSPVGLALDPAGGFLIGDYARVRRVSPDGVIATIAGGSSVPGPYPEVVDPLQTRLVGPVYDVATAADGRYWLAETTAHRVRQVTP